MIEISVFLSWITELKPQTEENFKIIEVRQPNQLLPFNAIRFSSTVILFFCTTFDSSYANFGYHFLIEKHVFYI